MPYRFPFAYVSGQGHGISYSSQVRSGALAEPIRKFGQAGVQAYANIFNQNLIFLDRQIPLYEFGLPLNIYAVYNSLGASNNTAWQLSVKKRLTVVPEYPDGAQAVLCEPDGHATSYTKGSKEGNLCWLPESLGSGDPFMVRDESLNAWVIYYPERELREVYNDAGELQTVTNANGEHIDYEYYPDGRLRTIYGQGGAYYLFDYSPQPDKGYVLSISAFDPERNIDDKLLNQYRFDAKGRLSSSISPSGYNSSYAYFGDTWFIQAVTQTDTTQMRFAFDTYMPDGKLTQVSVGQAYETIHKNGNTVTIERVGNASDLTIDLDDQGLVQSVSELRGYDSALPDMKYQKSYDYTDDKRLKCVTHWDNSQTTFTYTGQDIVVLAMKKFPNGKEEMYYYDNELLRYLVAKAVVDDGGKSCSYRLVYDYLPGGDDKKKVLRFSISPMGTVTEHRYDTATGLRTSSRTYLVNRLDVSDMRPDTAPSMMQMTEWVKDQDLANVQLTTFDYDAHGQHKTVKQYATVDPNGVGIDDAETAVVQTEYDEQHHLLSHGERYDDQYAFHRAWEYDDLSRQTAESIVFNQTDSVDTLHGFEDKSSQITTVSPNGKQKQQTYTRYGIVYDTVYKSDGGATPVQREAHGYFDPLQRMIANEQTDGKEDFTFYDKQNHLGYTVSNTGIVKSVQPDLTHRFTTTTHYATPISIEDLFLHLPRPSPNILPQADTLISILEKRGPSDDDRTSYEFHDLAGNLRYAVDTEGYLVEHQYNLRGMKLATIRYQGPITADELSGLKSGTNPRRQPDNTKDRYTRRFYDDDRHLIAKQDAAGYITEYQRDVAGRVIQETLYAAAAAFNGDFPAIRPRVDTANDARHYYFRNKRGQIICAVDAENFVSTFTYYANGLKKGEAHFYNALPADWNPNNMPDLPTAHTEDKTVSFAYDEFNRCVQHVDPYGLSNVKKYDKMGNLLLDRDYDAVHVKDPFDTTDAQLADPDKCRTSESQYDAWRQVIKGANRLVGAIIASIMTNPQLTPAEKEEKVAAVWADQSSRFAYDSSGLKLSATNTLGEVTQYFYDAERRLVLVIDPTGAATQHAYNAFNEKLSTRQFYAKIDLTKLPTDRENGFITSDVTALLSADDDKDITDHSAYDMRGKLKTHTDPEGYVTGFEYNAWGEVAVKHLSVNDKQPDCDVSYTYDARGNWTAENKVINGKTITHTRSFKTADNKMDASTDAEQNKTSYTYNRRSELATVTDPEQVVQHDSQYDAYGRVLTDVMPNGKEVHTYDQRSLRHTILHPEVGTRTLLTRNVFGEKVKEQDDIGAQNNYATTWTHDAAGEVAIATDEQGHQYEFERDTEGRQVNKTYPALSYDAARRVDHSNYDAAGHLTDFTEDKDGLALQSKHAPNAFGFDEILTDPRGIIRQNKFSRRGELLLATHDMGTAAKPGIRQTEAYTYNGKKTKKTYMQGDVTAANQYAVDFGVDGFNRNVSKTIDPTARVPGGVTAINIQQANVLDDNGKAIKHTDPRGGVFYMFYDDRGKLRFKINPDLSAFEMRYDAKGNMIYRRSYDQRIATGQIDETKTLSNVIAYMGHIASNQDTQTHHFYNANNQLRFAVSVVDNTGIIQEHLFDNASRDIGKVAYAKTMPGGFFGLTTSDIGTWTSNADNQGPNDRRLHHVLDSRGQKRFSFQPDGSVIESKFDAYGHTIMEIHYAAFVADPTPYLSQDPDAIQIPANPAEPNHVTYHIYDVRNKPQFTIVGNSVIGFVHDENGSVTQECHYNDPITLPDNYDDLVKMCRALLPNRTKDKVKDYVFDPLNHVVTVTDPEGHQDIYHRDSLGNEREHIDRATASWTFECDRAKRQTEKHYPPISIPTIEVIEGDDKLSITGMATVASVDKKRYDNANNVIVTTKNAGQPDAREATMQYTPMNHLQTLQIANILVDDRTKPADMATPPTKTVPLISQKFSVNAKGKTVALQAVNGAWQFDVFDAAERHVFKLKQRKGKFYVTQYVRNAFGEQLKLIHYNNPLDIDPQQYATTGVPLSVVTDNLVRDADHDQYKEFARTQRGHLQDVFEAPILWHKPGPDGPEVGQDQPRTQYRDDTRGKRVVIRRARFPNNPELDYIKRQWWDDQGNLIAEAESYLPTVTNGDFPAAMSYKVTLYSYNAKKEPLSKTEWANPITQMPDETMSYADLLALHQPSDDDRVHAFEHDLSSRMTKESLLNVTYHTLITNDGEAPTVQPQTVDKISTEFGYSPVGLRIWEKNAKGATIYTFYDARHNVYVKTGEPFTTEDADRGTVTMTPLQFVYHNAHGQKVAEVMYAKGANPVDPAKVPTARFPDDPDNTSHILLYDNRGSVYKEQDANGTQTVKLYDIARNMSRHFTTLTNYVPTYDADHPDQLENAKQVVHVEETQNDWDEVGNLERQAKFRDGEEVLAAVQTVNAFNALAASGDDDNPNQSFVQYNRTGHGYSTNRNKKGVGIVEFSDLMHKDTGYATSPAIDLSTLSESEVLAIMQDPQKRAQLNINSHFTTPQGKLLREERPPVTAYSGDVAQPVQMSLSVSLDAANKMVTISWPALQDMQLSPTLTLFPGGDISKPGTDFAPTVNNGLSEVVISDDQFESMTTDLYAYKLAYKSDVPVFEAQGQCVIDMGHDQNSTHVVAIVEEQATIHLIGNTTGLNGFDLYDISGNLVGHYLLKPSPDGRGYALDMFDMTTGGGDVIPSGEYTIQATRAREVDDTRTLPVTLYTSAPAAEDKPLPRTMGYSAELLTNDVLGELQIWNKLPVDYQKYDVQLTVDYIGLDDKTYTKTVTVNPEYVLPDGRYVDPDGHVMNANFKFEHSVKSVTDMTVSLVLDAKGTLLQLYKTEKPISQGLEVDSVHRLRGIERRKHLSSAIKTRTEDGDWQLTHQPTEPWVDLSDAAGDPPNPPEPSPEITTNQFAVKEIAYITPLAGFDPAKSALQYNDVTRATGAAWVDLTPDFVNADGVVINVIGIPDAAYQWRKVDNKTTITLYPYLFRTGVSDLSVLSQPQDAPQAAKTIASSVTNTLDVWDNHIATTDGMNATTKRHFNKTNKLVSVDNPPAPVMDDDGQFNESVVTSRQHYLDETDRRIAIKDERGKIRGILRDEAGNELKRILPDGVVARSILTYDGFEKVLRYADTRGKVWQETRDHKHQVIAVITPMGRKTAYTLNERGETIVDADPANQATIYGYGIAKGWLSLKKAPSGQLQVMVHHRSGDVHSATYGAAPHAIDHGDKLGQLAVTHDMDFFGIVMKTTLMDGTTVYYTLDQGSGNGVKWDFEKHSQRIVSRTAEGASPRQYRPLITKHVTSGDASGDVWQLGALVDVPNQDLEQYWSGGMLVQQIDHAEKKQARFGFDGNLKRVLHDDETVTGWNRKRAELDSRGNIHSMRDNTATFEIQRSATGLARRQKGTMKAPDGTVFSLDQGTIYDDVDRPLIQGGAWNADKQAPELADGQGNEFGYDSQTGVRVAEHTLREGANISATIAVDDDMRVIATSESDVAGKIKIDTKREYGPVALSSYTETSTGASEYTSTRNLKVDGNQRVVWDYTTDTRGGNPKQTAVTGVLLDPKDSDSPYVGGFNSQGGPVYEVTTNASTDSHGNRPTTTTTTHSTYIGLEDQRLSSVSATTSGPGGSKDISPAIQSFDSSRTMVSRTNVDTGYTGEESFDEVYDAGVDGTISRTAGFKSASGGTVSDLFNSGHLKENFHDPDDNLVASYQKPRDPRLGADLADDPTASPQMHLHERTQTSMLHGGMKSVVRGDATSNALTQGPTPPKTKGFEMVEQDPSVIDEPTPESFADYKTQTGGDSDGYRGYIPQPVSSFPPATQDIYRPQQPMTAAEISKQMFGSDAEAGMIAQANGGKPLDFKYPAYFDVTIPNLQILTFESDRSLVISRIMAIFEGSLQPHISFAPVHHKKKKHCKEKVIHILIEVISAIVALPFKECPPLAALVAALEDMELQALAKACHLIKHFSWAEVMDSAIAAGLTAAMPIPAGSGVSAAGGTSGAAAGAATSVAVQQAASNAFVSFAFDFSHLTVAGVMELAEEQATINITTQLANIAMRFQKKFDVRSVFDTMLVSVFDSGIEQMVKLPSSTLSVDNNLFDGVVHGAENIAESYVADAITGSPKHIDDLLANALGTSVGSVLSTYMPVLDLNGKGKSANHAQHSLKPNMKHASNMPDDPNHGLDPLYKVSLFDGMGGTGGDIAMPHYPDAWQQAQAEGLSMLNSNSNRPVTSASATPRSPYTSSDSYQSALHAAGTASHAINTMMHNGMHLLVEAAERQAAARPTHVNAAVNGGAPSSTPTLFGHQPSPKVSPWDEVTDIIKKVENMSLLLDSADKTFKEMIKIVNEYLPKLTNMPEIAIASRTLLKYKLVQNVIKMSRRCNTPIVVLLDVLKTIHDYKTAPPALREKVLFEDSAGSVLTFAGNNACVEFGWIVGSGVGVAAGDIPGFLVGGFVGASASAYYGSELLWWTGSRIGDGLYYTVQGIKSELPRIGADVHREASRVDAGIHSVASSIDTGFHHVGNAIKDEPYELYNRIMSL